MQERQQQPVASKRALSRLVENEECLLKKKRACWGRLLFQRGKSKKICSKAAKAQLWIILARGKRLPFTRWLHIK